MIKKKRKIAILEFVTMFRNLVFGMLSGTFLVKKKNLNKMFTWMQKPPE